MPAPASLTLSQQKSIHLFRSLLRETSYLPDAHARSYFRRYIASRFNSYQPAHNAVGPKHSPGFENRRRAFKRRHISIINDRARAMQRKARKGLNYLRRANLGELPCLEKILLFTYGRMGKRRYALLEKLMQPEPMASGLAEAARPENALSPLQEVYFSNKRHLQFFNAPKKISETHLLIDVSSRYSKLRSVISSQAHNGISIGREIRTPKLKTPIHNVWERPMPIKRARNDVKRWYANTMSKLLPPLPAEEWDRLRALATGEMKWKDSVARRTLAGGLSFQLDNERVHSKNVLESGLALDKPSKADKPRGKDRPHAFTSNMMKRLYARILAYSCKLEWDDKRGNWTACWGLLKDVKPRIYSDPVDGSLFAGVNTNGRLPRSVDTSEESRPPGAHFYSTVASSSTHSASARS